MPAAVKSSEKLSDEPGDLPVVRPPGALQDSQAFLDTCHRCQACSAACPYDVISHLGPAAGEEEGTPFIKPEENPCHWCPTMDCLEACPSGALAYNDKGCVDPIAKAELDLNACLTQQGILCDDCVSACPTSVKALKLHNLKPQLDLHKCVGCGLCSYYCPTTPVAIRNRPGRD
jgi:MauM/NapG family ferredoxin protein